MPAILRLAGVLVTGACTLLAARSAAGAESAEPEIHDDGLAYQAVGRGCPLESTYRAEARKRMPERTDRARTLRVKLVPVARGFEGTVEAIERSAGRPRVVASRTVAGTTCEEVADATLLLVALGLLEAPPPPPPPAPAPAPPAPAPAPEPAPIEPAPAPPAVRPTFHVAGLALAASGFGPVAVGGGARLGVGLERRGLVRPELRLGVDVVGEAELRNAIGTARRSLLAGRLDLCPLAFGTRPVLARICAAGAVGEVRVRGENVDSPRDEGRLYTAVGALLRGHARLAGGLGADLSVGVLAPIEPHRFFFEPDATLFRLDRPVPFVEGGLSWSIP